MAFEQIEMKPWRYALAPLCVLLFLSIVAAQDENRALLRRKLIGEIEKIANGHDGVIRLFRPAVALDPIRRARTAGIIET